MSLADLIVLGGNIAVEAAAYRASYRVAIPFTPGHTDAVQEMTDVESFSQLEPKSDGFRNYMVREIDRPTPELLIDPANLLTLTAPEMTVLIGGLRVPKANSGTGLMADLGVLTDKQETLTNDFFVNLLNMDTTWKKSPVCDHFFEGRDRESGEMKWTASAVDLVLGSNSQLRAISEVYAAEDNQEKFGRDFALAWTKLMNLDRFDLEPSKRYPASKVQVRGVNK